MPRLIKFTSGIMVQLHDIYVKVGVKVTAVEKPENAGDAAPD